MAQTDSIALIQEAIGKLISGALEIANEIEKASANDYCLASTIADMLEENSTAKGLADILEERRSGSDSLKRLAQTLKEIQGIAQGI